jgi:hypothetical protein
MTIDIENFPKLSSSVNLKELQENTECGCYFCLKTFVFKDCDLIHTAKDTITALCPNCNIDTVVPNVIDIEVLKQAHIYWFCTVTGKEKDEWIEQLNKDVLIDQLKRKVADLENQLEDIKYSDVVAYQSSRNGFIAKENKNLEYNIPLIKKPF